MTSPRTYDVVIVGSGLGGLLTAVLLAKEGKKVCILEKDKQLGGCLQTFSIRKKVFDSCVHYIGGLGEGHTLHRIFSYAGIMDKLQLKVFDKNAFDKIAFGDEEIAYPQAQGFDNFVEQLTACFPGERPALEQYVKLVQNVGDHFPLYRLRLGSADEKTAVSNMPLMETLRSITNNQRLQQVLVGNNLLYAGEAERTPFYLHALVLESYMHSAHKVMPGSSQVSKFLWQQLQDLGADVFRNKEVTKLVEENGQISYALDTNGERYYGKDFIANVHPQVLLNMVDSSLFRPAFRNRINNLQQTISAFMLNIVVDPGTIPMQRSNLYWHATNDAWAATHYQPKDWPANYALYYTEDEQHPSFAESISVLTYMHFDEVNKWTGTLNHAGHPAERGSEYEAFKEEKTNVLLNAVYKRLPELKGNIVATSAATPLTYRDYTATPQGSLYGNLKDVHKPAETTIATRTRIPNLLLTGQNVNLHGVLGVSITAIATAAELVGMEHLLSKINKAS